MEKRRRREEEREIEIIVVNRIFSSISIFSFKLTNILITGLVVSMVSQERERGWTCAEATEPEEGEEDEELPMERND